MLFDYELRDKAEHLAKVVNLRSIDAIEKFYSKKLQSKTPKSYEVTLDGEVIGEVFQVEATSHKKQGRLIFRTFHRVAWNFRIKNGDYMERLYRHGLTEETRLKAIRCLVEEKLKRSKGTEE